MRSDTQAIELPVPAARAFAFISDGANLPLWTLGFVRQARSLGGGRWAVETPRGDQIWQADADPGTGVIDFHTALPPADRRTSHSRVIDMGRHCLFMFTILQYPELSDEQFEGMRKSVMGELESLRSILGGPSVG